MCTGKIHVCFNGNISTKIIAQITQLFALYRINILDIHMYNIGENQSQITIVCEGSSTTDEIDSFWNDLTEFTKNFNINYTKNYI